MKLRNVLMIVMATILFAGCQPGETEEAKKQAEDNLSEVKKDTSREFYLLKIYKVKPDAQLAVTESYLRDAYVPTLSNLGYGPIGVFKNRPEPTDTVVNVFVLIPMDRLIDMENMEERLKSDQNYLQTGAAFLEAPHDDPPFIRQEALVLKAFEYQPGLITPKVSGPRSERVYELRSYESPTESKYWNKVDMFNAGGEVTLFDSLDFNAVFYGEVLVGPRMPNLIYMTTFNNMVDRDEHWEQFVASPQWQQMSTDPKYQDNVNNAEVHLLYPTEYSDY